VLVLEPGAEADAVIRDANAGLEEHQRISSASIWTWGELPRTKSTGKLRRAEIARALEQVRSRPAAESRQDLASVIEKYAPGRTVGPDTTMEELGLSSLDRVELMMDLETKLGASIDESALAEATNVEDLMKTAESPKEAVFPRYNRPWISRLIRRCALAGVLLPATRAIAPATVSGLENLTPLRGPVIFAANHRSHADAPVVLASLPRGWRYRISPAMWKEFFDAHFHPERHTRSERWKNSLIYALTTLLCNGFPIPQTEAEARIHPIHG
jgi:long-chain acyl-CoA synthetase